MEEREDQAFREQGNALHNRLLAGDVTASAEIADQFLPLTARLLHRLFPRIHDPDLVETAVDDALLSYLERPSQYDPEKLALGKYLLMSARGDLLHLLRQQQHRGFPKGARFVELDAGERELTVETGVASSSAESEALDRASPVFELLQRLLPEPKDLEAAILMLQGVRDTETFAAVLGIGNLGQEERQAEVKRTKDRIKKSLKRNIDLSDLDVGE